MLVGLPLGCRFVVRLRADFGGFVLDFVGFGVILLLGLFFEAERRAESNASLSGDFTGRGKCH